MQIKLVLSTILIFILSGPDGRADAPSKVNGDLFAFSREVTISAKDCENTYKFNFDTQAECKVQLWPADAKEISLQPLPLIGLWQYRDDNFKLTVTFTREITGYSVRLDSNDIKFKDRLQYQVAQKYIASAIEQKKFEKFTTLVARTTPQLKLGPNYTEVSKGAVKVYAREILFQRNSLFTQKCREVWNGLTCGFNLIRNTKGESLFGEVQPTKIVSGNLILQIKSYPGWRDGTSYSSLNVQLFTNRAEPNFESLRNDLDGIFRQISKLEFKAIQLENDAATNAVYSQKLLGPLTEVEQSLEVDANLCKANYKYASGQFKGRCEVIQAWPGLLAQPATAFMDYLNLKNVGAFVTVNLTPNGWKAEFSGDEKMVGKFSAVEAHFAQAAKVLLQAPPRLFIKH